MSENNRYDRQQRIENWDQNKITSASICLIGSDRLSDFLLADFLSMGFGNILRIGYSDFFEFEKINPQINLEQNGEFLASRSEAERMIENSIVIDATNDECSKYISSRIAKEKKLPYFSASCDNNSFSLFNSQDYENAGNFHKQINSDQANLSSIICSAIICDELRKKIMPLKGDISLGSYTYENIHERDCLEDKLRIMQIGAGAIGTFASLGLSLINASIFIYDDDRIDDSNLNRQFLFYDSVGLKKAEILAERIKKYTSSNIFGKDKRIENEFQPKGFDAVFSCVDNASARYILNRSCKRYIVPLVNAGSSLNSCDASVSFTNKTLCLDCQRGFKLTEKYLEERERRGSAKCFHPSIIISNQIAGGLMVNALLKSMNGVYEKSLYQSGFGINDSTLEKECYSECKN
jgi:molybdopterin/thiamine biosynthesis adenylyltransferase